MLVRAMVTGAVMRAIIAGSNVGTEQAWRRISWHNGLPGNEIGTIFYNSAIILIAVVTKHAPSIQIPVSHP